MVLAGFVGGFGWFWVVLGGFGWFRVLVTTKNESFIYISSKFFPAKIYRGFCTG